MQSSFPSSLKCSNSSSSLSSLAGNNSLRQSRRASSTDLCGANTLSRGSSAQDLRNLATYAKKPSSKHNDHPQDMKAPEPHNLKLEDIKDHQGLQHYLNRLSQPIAEQILAGDLEGFSSNTVDVQPANLPKISLTTTNGERISVNSVSITPLTLPIIEGGISGAITHLESESGQPQASVEIGTLLGIHLPNHAERMNWTIGVAADKQAVKPFIKAEISTATHIIALRLNMNTKFEPTEAVVTLGEKQTQGPMPNCGSVSSEHSKNINITIEPEVLQKEMKNIIEQQLTSFASFFKSDDKK